MKNYNGVVILHDNWLIREGIAHLMGGAGYKVVLSTSNLTEFTALMRKSRSVALCIVEMNFLLDAQWVNFKEENTECRLVALAEACSRRQYLEAESRGADGIVSEAVSGEALLEILHFVLMTELDLVMLGHPFGAVGDVDEGARRQGGASVAAAAAGEPRAAQREVLSDREAEILLCLVEGSSNKVIARRCNISEATVKAHLKSILRKISGGQQDAGCDLGGAQPASGASAGPGEGG